MFTLPIMEWKDVTELRVFIYTLLRIKRQILNVCTLLARGQFACAGLGQWGRMFIFTQITAPCASGSMRMVNAKSRNISALREGKKQGVKGYYLPSQKSNTKR